MRPNPARLALTFSSIGHLYIHLFTAFYFTIVLAIEASWERPFHELLDLWTFGALLVGAAALPAGWLGDRWSAPGMMVIFFVGMGVGAILCGVSDTTTALWLGLATIGLFAAIYHPVGIAWLVRNAKARGRALGLNGVFGAAGVAAAATVAGGLIDLFGWRAAFIVPGVISVLTGLVMWSLLAIGWMQDSTVDRAPEPPASRSDMVRVAMILLLTMFSAGIIFHGTQASMPKMFELRLTDIVGHSTAGVGALVGVVYAVGGVMQYFGGELADRFNTKRIYVLCYVGQVPLLAALAAFAGIPLILAAVLMVALVTAALPAENMLLSRYTPAQHRSLVFGIKFVLAFGAAPLAIRAVAFVNENTGGFFWVFAGFAGMAAVSLLAASMLPNGRTPAPVAAAQPAE
jgi:MFS family permease